MVTSSWLIDSFTKEEVVENRVLAELSFTIQQQRKVLGLTQAELARKLGVSQELVSRWENGEENLTIETIAKITVALGIDTQNP